MIFKINKKITLISVILILSRLTYNHNLYSQDVNNLTLEQFHKHDNNLESNSYNSNSNNIDNSSDDDEFEIIEEEVDEDGNPIFDNKIIDQIIITGNENIPKNLILTKIPYFIGQIFNPVKTGEAIKNIDKLGYFSDIKLYGENLTLSKPGYMNLVIEVEEKSRIDDIELTGNKTLKKKDIEEKLKLNEIKALDEYDTERLIQQIKNLYKEKNYHSVKITPEIKKSESQNINDKLLLKVEEGPMASVRRLHFIGNKAFSDRILKKKIYTKEDWILGFMEKAGVYLPEMVEGDKHAIENFYQSNGYLTAKVKDTKLDINKDNQTIEITYIIEEGDKYTITEVNIPEADDLKEDQLKAAVGFLRPGMLYSRELIKEAIDKLKKIWGQRGYVYADINPDVIPNNEDKTVKITLNSELGNKIKLRRINITGHKKTREYVIRRYLELEEGQPITSNLMDLSKKQIESIGFFEPKEGVEWRTIRIDDETADLELMLQEMKTGKLNAQIGFGGIGTDILQSPSSGFNAGINIAERNLFGTGTSINLNTTYSLVDRTIVLSVAQPWLFDRPITGGGEFYRNKRNYDFFMNTLLASPFETVTGGNLNLGFIRQTGPWRNTRFWCEFGLEKICNNTPPQVNPALFTAEQRNILQESLRSEFKSGQLSWLLLSTGQDLRNHPIFPSRGYSWTIGSKLSLPRLGSGFGYYRADLDSNYYTPLIGEYDLIFGFHAHAGFIHNFSQYDVPYRELFHIGGPATVRGFKYGQIGPSILSDSLGAKKAFWINAELVFRITNDMSTRALLFYDGGAGWDSPNSDKLINAGLPLKNNYFNFRHAVGFGIRLLNPAPIRIDWAFKLDRNKRLGEQIHEVHFSMSQDF